ncbi:hypothetical protein D3C85_1072270 [compost metagenome]
MLFFAASNSSVKLVIADPTPQTLSHAFVLVIAVNKILRFVDSSKPSLHCSAFITYTIAASLPFARYIDVNVIESSLVKTSGEAVTPAMSLLMPSCIKRSLMTPTAVLVVLGLECITIISEGLNSSSFRFLTISLTIHSACSSEESNVLN